MFWGEPKQRMISAMLIHESYDCLAIKFWISRRQKDGNLWREERGWRSGRGRKGRSGGARFADRGEGGGTRCRQGLVEERHQLRLDSPARQLRSGWGLLVLTVSVYLLRLCDVVVQSFVIFLFSLCGDAGWDGLLYGLFLIFSQMGCDQVLCALAAIISVGFVDGQGFQVSLLILFT